MAHQFVQEKIGYELTTFSDDILERNQEMLFNLLVFTMNHGCELFSYRRYGMIGQNGKALMVVVCPSLWSEWENIKPGMVVSFDGKVIYSAPTLTIDAIGSVFQQGPILSFTKGNLPAEKCNNCSIVAVVEEVYEYYNDNRGTVAVRCLAGADEDFILISSMNHHINAARKLSSGTVLHVSFARFMCEKWADEMPSTTWQDTNILSCNAGTVLYDAGHGALPDSTRSLPALRMSSSLPISEDDKKKVARKEAKRIYMQGYRPKYLERTGRARRIWITWNKEKPHIVNDGPKENVMLSTVMNKDEMARFKNNERRRELYRQKKDDPNLFEANKAARDEVNARRRERYGKKHDDPNAADEKGEALKKEKANARRRDLYKEKKLAEGIVSTTYSRENKTNFVSVSSTTNVASEYRNRSLFDAPYGLPGINPDGLPGTSRSFKYPNAPDVQEERERRRRDAEKLNRFNGM